MTRGGKRYGRSHAPVESCHSLSSWGYFQYAQMWAYQDDQDTFKWEIGERKVKIQFTRDGRAYEQEITLTFTPCRFGSRRTWFTCPKCYRRVGKLYLPCSVYIGIWRVTSFLCRFCYDLTYVQRRERTLYWTYRYRTERIENRWLGEITDDWINKQKGQHLKTFNKWCDRREELIDESDQGFFNDVKKHKFFNTE